MARHDGHRSAIPRLVSGGDGAPLDWTKPRFPAGVYPNSRWQKLFREMTYYDDLGSQVYRAPVSQYLCRQWNAEHPPERHIAEFELVFCSMIGIGADGSPSGCVVRPRLAHLDLAGR